MAAFPPPAASRGPFAHPVPVTTHGAPVGTFAPGTKVQVGNHRVIIEKYLSEGGFAHVYVVRLPKPVDGSDQAVLKRVAVPDKDHLANMRTEVETMKKLKGHRQIVRYIDSHASQLKGGGYEVFLLMEYCSGGGLIDFMNTRLRNRLTEPEILNIFSDVAEGVACMHYLRPPLLHRDLKVENVLISHSGSSKTYKLCDFGSAAAPRPAVSSAAEGRLMEDDIQRHTTLQYRSPEMIDVYRKQPINEKSDVWALGVFLYKLCYYTTPFEEVGQMAILNASFKYPAHPSFSDQLKLLIATMLRENPAKRPNIYQVLQQACSLQGKEVPVRDIYASRSQSVDRRSQKVLSPSEKTPTVSGAMLSPPSEKAPAAMPDIAPMRRGRPTKAVSHHGSAQPSPSPLRMMEPADPFASLDGSKAGAGAGDELSSRSPTLDQFSLLGEKGKFEFEPSGPSKPDADKQDLSQRVLNALADDAFARPPSPERAQPSAKTAPPVTNPSSRVVLDKRPSEAIDIPVRQDAAISSAPPKRAMVSTGTMTCPSPPPLQDDRPIHRFPPSDHAQRPSSLPRSSESTRPLSAVASSGTRLSNLLEQDAARSQPATLEEPRSSASSRPSLESGRSFMMEQANTVSRSKSTNAKTRPASMNLVSKMELYRGRKSSKQSMDEVEKPSDEELPPPAAIESDTTITSDVEFLRAKEEEEKAWKGHKRQSSGSLYKKRSSLPSISLSGTKNMLAGRFGDAFRKFEGGGNNGSGRRSRSPSPSQEPLNILTPIAGSEATDLSDERLGLEETEDLSPEMRRELERRRLSAEEKRVANAAAEYRRRLAEKGGGGRDPTRAVSIQNKVQSLLTENEKPTTKSASGYGRFTDPDASPQMKQLEMSPSPAVVSQQPQPPRASSLPKGSTPAPSLGQPSPSPTPSAVLSSSTVHSVNPTPRTTSKPTAPPKPKKMRTGGGEAVAPRDAAGAFSATKAMVSPSDDWEADFSKRYPSLSGLEMVETDIDGPVVAAVRTREI